MERRDFLKAAAFTTAGAVVGPTLLERAGSLLSSPALAAAGGTMFGCSAQEYGGQSREQLITYLEGLGGSPFDTVQNRFGWTTSFVNKYSRWIVETGRTPILAWSTNAGSGDITWRSIANGTHDARLRAEGKALAAAGWRAYVAFHKEPENEPHLGNAAEWKAAHDRIVELFRQEGATNVRFVPTLTAATYNGLNGGPSAWLPARYDVLGVDGYNRNTRGQWRSFESIFTPAIRAARDRSAQLYVTEAGCVEGAPGAKGDWFRSLAATADTWPELIGVSYNHEAGKSGNDSSMNYRVDTSTLAIEGFRDMQAHAAFTGETGGGDGGGDGGGTDECETATLKLANRRERMRTLRDKLERQRKKTRKLKRRAA